MHQLPESDWPAALLIAEFRQAAPGDQTRGPQPVNRTGPICVFCVNLLTSALNSFLSRACRLSGVGCFRRERSIMQLRTRRSPPSRGWPGCNRGGACERPFGQPPAMPQVCPVTLDELLAEA